MGTSNELGRGGQIMANLELLIKLTKFIFYSIKIEAPEISKRGNRL